jgi:hypothetical protein
MWGLRGRSAHRAARYARLLLMTPSLVMNATSLYLGSVPKLWTARRRGAATSATRPEAEGGADRCILLTATLQLMSQPPLPVSWGDCGSGSPFGAV